MIAIVTLRYELNTLRALPMTIGIKWLKSVMLTTRNKIYELSLQPLVAFEFFEMDSIQTETRLAVFPTHKIAGGRRGKSSEKER